MSRGLALVRSSARNVRWFVTTLMGDRAYDVYVAHRATTHPGVDPLSERQFWIDRYREQESSPGSRCC